MTPELVLRLTSSNVWLPTMSRSAIVCVAALPRVPAPGRRWRLRGHETPVFSDGSAGLPFGSTIARSGSQPDTAARTTRGRPGVASRASRDLSRRSDRMNRMRAMASTKLIHGAAGLITTTVLAALTPGVAAGTAATAPDRRAHTAVHRIHVAALTVPLPAGWHWVVHRGNYRDCSNPIGVLALASYRLVGHGNHEGPTVVPANGILLELSSLPIRSGARPWRRWRLSNHELQPARTVGPNRYAAVVFLPRSPAVVASAWFGSVPAPPSVLAAANRILRNARINQAYGCQ